MRSLQFVLLIALTIQAGCSGEPETKTLNQQFQAAMALKDLRQRGNRLVRLSYEQAEAGDAVAAERSLAGARQAANGMSDPRDQSELLNYVGFAYGKLGHPGTTKKVLAEVRTAADKISKPDQRVPVLAKMAEIYERFLESENAAKNLLVECEPLAMQAVEPDAKVRALMELAYYHSRLKHTSDVDRLDARVAEVIQSAGDAKVSAEMFMAQASGLVKRKSAKADDAYKAAEGAIAKISDPLSRGHSWLKLARRLKHDGRQDMVANILAKAKSAADKVKDGSLRTPLLDQISQAYDQE